jgi:hypothetical protein
VSPRLALAVIAALAFASWWLLLAAVGALLSSRF